MLSQNQTKRLFKQCNYTQVALFGDHDCWEKYAAYALIGKTSEALDYFRSCHDFSDAAFYEGVAHWIDGHDELAQRALNNANSLHAQNLRSLIQKQQIQVLAQIPWIRNHFTDWLAGVNNDPKFKVNNISFHKDDTANKPYADIHQFYSPNTPPDFYICQMVEWHLIPPNIQELTCPIFGQTADYDLHIQAVYPWLQLFDELLVTDGTEWNDVKDLVSVPVSTFPKSFCLIQDLPELQVNSRPIDLYLSGTVTHPYHPDKADLLSQILHIPKLNIKVVHGFTGTDEYYKNLSNSKVCFTYVRHPGATPTRGLEALSLGCALVVQEESVLRLFVGEAEGVITYSHEQANLADRLTHIAHNWSEYQAKALRGAKIIREEFSTEKVASQYLRYLTVLAAKPGVTAQRKQVNHNRLVQKRTVLQKGWLPSHDFDRTGILTDVYQANRDKLTSLHSQAGISATTAIDLTREIILFHYHHSMQTMLLSPAWLNEIEHISQDAIHQFPQTLVLQFNLLRARLHFGNPVKVSQAIKSGLDIVEKPIDYWHINKREDIFPYDIFDNYFNYRSYFDCLVTNLTTDQNEFSTTATKLILASVYYYLGLYTCDIHYFAQACALDPAFATYKMGYLGQAERNSKTFLEDNTAKQLLIELRQGTTEFLRAHRIIQTYCSARDIDASQLLGTEVCPIYTSINVVEQSSPDLLRPSMGKLLNPFRDIVFTKKMIRDSIKVLKSALIRWIPKQVKSWLKQNLLFRVHDIFSDWLINRNVAQVRFSRWVHKIRQVSADRPTKVSAYSKDPKLVGSNRHHNYVLLGETYYGVPKSLGNLDLNRAELVENKKIIRQASLKDLKLACRPAKPQCYSNEPKLIGKAPLYNYVLLGNTYYGVPKSLGEINLQQINLAECPEIIHESSITALKLACHNSSRPRQYSETPKLVSSTRHYNCVLLGNVYYGIPKFLGELDLHRINLDDYSMIICESSLSALKWLLRWKTPQNFFANHFSRVTPEKHPILVQSWASYHIFWFRDAFYGVPVAFGDTNLEGCITDKAQLIPCDRSLTSLKRRILQGQVLYSQPALLEHLSLYYVVAWEQVFYAIPTIYGKLDNPLDVKTITEILNGNRKAIFRDLSVVNLRRKIRIREFTYQALSGEVDKANTKPGFFTTEALDEESLVAIAKLAQTPVWQMRILKWRIQQKLLAFIARVIGK